jgi:hypothetical protein
MEFESYSVRYDEGEYIVAVSVREYNVAFQEFEGIGDTLPEALHDLAEQLEVADV